MYFGPFVVCVDGFCVLDGFGGVGRRHCGEGFLDCSCHVGWGVYETFWGICWWYSLVVVSNELQQPRYTVLPPTFQRPTSQPI